MPMTTQPIPKQTGGTTRPQPPVKQTSQAPETKKPIFSDWASI